MIESNFNETDKLIAGVCYGVYSGTFSRETKKYAKLRLEGNLYMARLMSKGALYHLIDDGDVMYVVNGKNIIGRFLIGDDGIYSWDIM